MNITLNLFAETKIQKTPNNPVCIDLILTNVPRSFQSACVVETGLPDFHLITLTVMRTIFKKYHPKMINYRLYKIFSNEAFRETLINHLPKENYINDDNGFQRFCHISLDALNKHAPRKKKHARGIHPASIYLLKVNNRNTRTRCQVCSKLTIKTPERRQLRRSGVFIVKFEHVSHLALVFLLLTLNM